MSAQSPVFTAVVVAAGSGTRMQSDRKKQFMELCGVPMVVYCLRAFEKNEYIRNIVLVVPEEDIDYCMGLCLKYCIRKARNIVSGGEKRFRSVLNGLKAVPEDTDYVLIHDGARPLLTGNLIDRICEFVKMTKACTAAVPVKDTIKMGDPKGFCLRTVDRRNLWQIQTPQAFSFRLLLEAYSALLRTIEEYHSDESVITDDAVVVENMTNTRVRLVTGDYSNLKVTTPEDLIIAEALIKNGYPG